MHRPTLQMEGNVDERRLGCTEERILGFDRSDSSHRLGDSHSDGLLQVAKHR